MLTLLSQATNGTTYDQIKSGLNLHPRKDDVANQYQALFAALEKDKGPSTFSLVNEIYVQKGLEISKNFSDVAKAKFSAGIESLNFAKSEKSAKVINNFVKTKTNKKITEIIKSSDLNSNTELVLVNAIYFKADWEIKFNKNRTAKGPFYTSKNETVQAEFMSQKAKFGYGELYQSTVLEMKYAKSNFSFVIVLPNNNTSLADVEARLTFDQLNTFLHQTLALIEVDVKIPKFGVEYEVDMRNVLQKVCTKLFHY